MTTCDNDDLLRMGREELLDEVRRLRNALFMLTTEVRTIIEERDKAREMFDAANARLGSEFA